MTGWTKSEQPFKRKTMIKGSTEQANTAAVRTSETESAIAHVRNKDPVAETAVEINRTYNTKLSVATLKVYLR